MCQSTVGPNVKLNVPSTAADMSYSVFFFLGGVERISAGDLLG